MFDHKHWVDTRFSTFCVLLFDCPTCLAAYIFLPSFHFAARQIHSIHNERRRATTTRRASTSRRTPTWSAAHQHPRPKWRAAHSRANSSDSNAASCRSRKTRYHSPRICPKAERASHGPAAGTNEGATGGPAATATAAHPTWSPKARSNCGRKLAQDTRIETADCRSR